MKYRVRIGEDFELKFNLNHKKPMDLLKIVIAFAIPILIVVVSITAYGSLGNKHIIFKSKIDFELTSK